LVVQKSPTANLAGLFDSFFNDFPVTGLQPKRSVTQFVAVMFFPASIVRDSWGAVSIMKSIYRTSLVAVQPGAVGSESNQVRERKVVYCLHEAGSLLVIVILCWYGFLQGIADPVFL
jgi:hypothetical protein